MKYWKNSILIKPFLQMNLPGEVKRDVNFDIYYPSKEIHIKNSRIKKKSKWKTVTVSCKKRLGTLAGTEIWEKMII